MRTYAWLALALAVTAAGCTGERHSAALSKDLSALTPCESREIEDLVLVFELFHHERFEGLAFAG